ncbi:unnamed protein product [Clonostachys rosea]|uniref:AB hydrolase-1 domain-containing protein n=1 Tax=Bionectria ochroleuca TaxID=29856 RepID=A0ABY6UAF2_BIOOC|nr:unnamed protein product [Clonostachys rosea]
MFRLPWNPSSLLGPALRHSLYLQPKIGFTVIICPRAWPLDSFFEPLIQAFRDRGHAAICRVPESYSTFDPINPPTFNPDSEHLRTQVLEPAIETGADIVVFMHSYGGVYGAESLKGLSKQDRQAKGLEGGVIAAILTCAFLAPTGSTALDSMGISAGSLPESGRHEQGICQAVFNDLPEEEGERLANLLPKQSITCFTTPVNWDPYQDPNIKRRLGFIYTEADRIFPIEAQRQAVSKAEIKHTYLLENSSHSPHLEQPQHLAGLVINMVRDITSSTEV